MELNAEIKIGLIDLIKEEIKWILKKKWKELFKNNKKSTAKQKNIVQKHFINL